MGAEVAKSNYLIPLLILIFITVISDLYSYKGLKLIIQTYQNPRALSVFFWAFWSFTAVVILSLILTYIIYPYIDLSKSYSLFFLISSIFMSILFPKLVFIGFHLMEDIVYYAIKLFVPDLSRFLLWSKIGLILSVIPFILFMYGIVIGRFDYTVNNYKIDYSNLPQEFDGIRIAVFSDMHIGSFRLNPERIKDATELINKQNADVIFFAGDMINNFANELDGFEPCFSDLHAPMGKYAILGNHDYGEYYNWKNDSLKNKNFEQTKLKIKEMGFRLLLNENVILERNNSKIALIGVENWGKPPFPSYGKLAIALLGCDSIPFKILLSHDPSHWDAEVKEKTNIDLTISGHTHGMQFGIKTDLLKWSPVSLKYDKWGGVYESGVQKLFVSTGLGYIGYSGRVGIRPEIAIIELKKKQ
jgi:uncharacterized protein